MQDFIPRLQIALLTIGLLLLSLSLLPAQAQTTQIQYLSGVDKDNTVAWNFKTNAGRNANVQTTIPVPSNWELKGFGTYTYQAAPASPATALYSTTFTVPASWAGQRIVLVFEGAMTDTSVMVNGTAANLTLDGVNGGPLHQGGFYRFQYNVTGLVNVGQSNTLNVTVSEESANASINSAERRGDYWNFAGIYRPVYLEAFPAQSIDRVAINAKADGTFNMDAYGIGITTASTVEAQVLDLAGNAVGPAFTASISGSAPKAHLSFLFSPPLALWTAETPNLYQVQVRLKQGSTVLHQTVQKFGFRTMEVRPGAGFFVNGQRVLLKGTNRHSFWPDSGRCLSDAVSRSDIALMKGMNMNAVRMSHYPPDQHFLDDCDELGLYVLDELAGWQHAYDTPTAHRLVQEMVIRDVNHPSILIWDNANEYGWNTAVDGDFALYDPQARPVNHPKTGGDTSPFNNILDSHYPPYSTVQTYAPGNAIYFPTEFLHGQYDGGAGAGLADYWDVLRGSGSVAGGGMIWSFLDEDVKRVDQVGTPLDSSGGSAPDGILGPYRQPEASAFSIKETWSPIVFTDSALPSGSSVTLHVDNRYDFLNLQQCSFVWELRQFPRPRSTAGGTTSYSVGTASTSYTLLAQGTTATGSVPARTSGTLALSLPSQMQMADALAVRALDPSGNEVWTKVWTLPAADAFRTVTTPPSRLPVSLMDTGSSLVARTGDLSVTVSKTTGLLTAVVRGGHGYSLTNGPRLVTGTTGTPTVTHQASGGDQIITATYATGNIASVVWRVQRTGWVKVSWTYTLTGAQNFYGVGFDYPEAKVQSLRWLGDGPYRTYKNRRTGLTTSVWQNTYNNTNTGVITNPSPAFQPYPEFKGYYGNVRWAQITTTEGLITAQIGNDTSYLQVFTPTLSGANLPAYPSASLSILDAIPPMGSKFAAANTTGPQGNQAVAAGTYQGSVNLYFGPLP